MQITLTVYFVLDFLWYFCRFKGFEVVDFFFIWRNPFIEFLTTRPIFVIDFTHITNQSSQKRTVLLFQIQILQSQRKNIKVYAALAFVDVSRVG